MQDSEKVLSLGEARVRTTFNPSANSAVDLIKQKTAELINLMESVKLHHTSDGERPTNSEALRLIALAQTTYEEAAMWAVKAATA